MYLQEKKNCIQHLKLILCIILEHTVQILSSTDYKDPNIVALLLILGHYL